MKFTIETQPGSVLIRLLEDVIITAESQAEREAIVDADAPAAQSALFATAMGPVPGLEVPNGIDPTK